MRPPSRLGPAGVESSYGSGWDGGPPGGAPESSLLDDCFTVHIASLSLFLSPLSEKTIVLWRGISSLEIVRSYSASSVSVNITYLTVPTFGTATATIQIIKIRIARAMIKQAALLALKDFFMTLASC